MLVPSSLRLPAPVNQGVRLVCISHQSSSAYSKFHHVVMRTTSVEIYSDATNAAVLRHPNRRFPGVLIQGDTLNNLAKQAEAISKAADGQLGEDDALEAKDLAESLRSFVEHYKAVLAEHQIPLPF